MSWPSIARRPSARCSPSPPTAPASRFAKGDPALSALAPGKILFLWGVALRRITSVQPDGEQLTVVTSSVSLPEVFRQADIEFDYHDPVQRPHRRARTSRPTTAPRTAMAPATGRDSFALLLPLTTPPRPPPRPRHPTWYSISAPAPTRSVAIAASTSTRSMARKATASRFRSRRAFTRTTCLTPARKPTDDPRKDMDAASKAVRDANAKALGDMQDKTDAQKRADEQVRQNAISNGYKKTRTGGPSGKDARPLQDRLQPWDLRLRAAGMFHGTSTNNGLAIGSHILIRNSALALMRTDFNNVNGNMKFQFIARRGEKSEQWIDKLKVELPMRFNIPVIVGGLPMMFQVAFNFIATPALATKNDSFVGEYDIPFSGNRHVSISDGKMSSSGTLKTVPQALQSLGSSIGVSAVLVAMQAPRVGLGLNLFAASSIAYIDLVSTATITSAGTLGMFPCRNSQLVSTINVGVDTQVSLDLPGIAKLLGKPLNDQLKKAGDLASTRETVFRKDWYRNEPDIKACQLDKK